MSTITNRRSGIVQELLLNNRAVAELICDFAHVVPETLKFTIDLKKPQNIIAVSDSIKPAKANLKESVSGGYKIIKDGIYLKLKKTGTIAGGNSVMLDNFKNIIQLGYSINQAVMMCSYNPAKHFNLKKLGQIKIGNEADLLILDPNLKLENVYIAGKKIK